MKNNMLDEWVIPEKFKEPEWVEKDFQRFKEVVKNALNDPKLKGNVNKIVKNAIKEIILDKKVDPVFPMNKKGISKTVQKMWEKFDSDEFIYRYVLLGRVGFFLATIKPAGFSIESLALPEEFKKKKLNILKEYEKKVETIGKDKAIQWVDKEFNKLTEEIVDYWEKNGIDTANIVRAGSRGGIDDIRKMLVAVGLSINSKGEINDVILNSHIDGLSQTQMFNYSSQAIQALYSKSSETAVPGYLARKLSTMMEPVNLSEIPDCKSNKYLKIEVLDEDILEAIAGRVTRSGKIIKETDTQHIGKTVELRSPLYCKAEDGICRTCYNPEYVKRLKLQPGAKIGLIVSTYMGSDALVNLTLKKSHVGISLDLEEVNLEEDIFKFAE